MIDIRLRRLDRGLIRITRHLGGTVLSTRDVLFRFGGQSYGIKFTALVSRILIYLSSILQTPHVTRRRHKLTIEPIGWE
jgi:hypothetical protein